MAISCPWHLPRPAEKVSPECPLQFIGGNRLDPGAEGSRGLERVAFAQEGSWGQRYGPKPARQGALEPQEQGKTLVCPPEPSAGV